jgi:hypothetical protein
MLRDMNRRPSLRDLGPLSLISLAVGAVVIVGYSIFALMVNLGMSFPSR